MATIGSTGWHYLLPIFDQSARSSFPLHSPRGLAATLAAGSGLWVRVSAHGRRREALTGPRVERNHARGIGFKHLPGAWPLKHAVVPPGPARAEQMGETRCHQAWGAPHGPGAGHDNAYLTALPGVYRRLSGRCSAAQAISRP